MGKLLWKGITTVATAAYQGMRFVAKDLVYGGILVPVAQAVRYTAYSTYDNLLVPVGKAAKHAFWATVYGVFVAGKVVVAAVKEASSAVYKGVVRPVATAVSKAATTVATGVKNGATAPAAAVKQAAKTVKQAAKGLTAAVRKAGRAMVGRSASASDKK